MFFSWTGFGEGVVEPISPGDTSHGDGGDATLYATPAPDRQQPGV